MSDSQSGANNPMFGRTGALSPMYGRTGRLNPMFGKTHTPETRAQMSAALSGANNPMFGQVAANAMTINVYSLEGKNSFSSQVAAANWLKIPRTTFQVYLKSGKVWNKLYTLVEKSFGFCNSFFFL
jgi:hypothetical protein